MTAASPIGAGRRAVRSALAPLVDFLLPSACLACASRIAGGGLVCAPCRGRLRPPPAPRCRRCDYPAGTGDRPGRPCLECLDWPEALGPARSAVALRPPADVLVHGLKYEGWRELAPMMAELMERRLLPVLHDLQEHVITHVPTSPAHRRRRGYDQAELLARALAARTGLACEPLLARRSQKRTQVSLHPQQRMANVRDAFSVRPSAGQPARGRDVLLVDDVLTTGATARAAAETLAGAGVRRVALATFARALPR